MWEGTCESKERASQTQQVPPIWQNCQGMRGDLSLFQPQQCLSMKALSQHEALLLHLRNKVWVASGCGLRVRYPEWVVLAFSVAGCTLFVRKAGCTSGLQFRFLALRSTFAQEHKSCLLIVLQGFLLKGKMACGLVFFLHPRQAIFPMWKMFCKPRQKESGWLFIYCYLLINNKSYCLLFFYLCFFPHPRDFPPKAGHCNSSIFAGFANAQQGHVLHRSLFRTTAVHLVQSLVLYCHILQHGAEALLQYHARSAAYISFNVQVCTSKVFNVSVSLCNR